MSELKMIVVGDHTDTTSRFSPPQYFVDVKVHDSMIDEVRRIEIHADVAKHIHEQQIAIQKRDELLRGCRLRLRNICSPAAFQLIAKINEVIGDE